MRLLLCACLALLVLLGAGATTATAADLDLETLGGREATKLMEEGKLTSVALTKAYIARIEALNKRGPGLNAVTQFIEPFVRLVLTSIPGTTGVARLLPAAASDALSVDTLFSAASSLPLLEQLQGGLVLAGYAAVLVLAGAVVTRRRTIA